LNKECSSDESCLGPWKRYPTLKAVKNGRLYQIDADELARPGPRLVDGLERLAALLHPEAGITSVAAEDNPRGKRSGGQ
jgi:iron complex transport system substrate-binding protein